MDEPKKYVATAFVSCSLRQEDKEFIELVEDILDQHNIKPFGTVGKYSAAPTNPAEHMKQNIPLADIVVIVATPRYLQKDLQTGQMSYGLPEMVHVETGMAYMSNKPVVVFVQEGTHVGNFIPNITEYIVLNGQHVDIQQKWGLISSLLNNAYNIVRQIKEGQSSKAFGSIVKTGFAIWGVASLLGKLFSDDETKQEEDDNR